MLCLAALVALIAGLCLIFRGLSVATEQLVGPLPAAQPMSAFLERAASFAYGAITAFTGVCVAVTAIARLV